LLKEGEIFGDLGSETLIKIVAQHIGHLQEERDWHISISRIGRMFGQTPETIGRVIDRLLPRFLLRVIAARENFDTAEESLARSYLVHLTRGRCHKKALSLIAVEHRQPSIVIKPILKNTLHELILSL